jgi:hypothetical protein
MEQDKAKTSEAIVKSSASEQQAGVIDSHGGDFAPEWVKQLANCIIAGTECHRGHFDWLTNEILYHSQSLVQETREECAAEAEKEVDEWHTPDIKIALGVVASRIRSLNTPA